MASAGNFEINVSGPYPCWCQIVYEGVTVATIHHNELSDLEYVAQKAMKEAIAKLPDKDVGEV